MQANHNVYIKAQHLKISSYRRKKKKNTGKRKRNQMQKNPFAYWWFLYFSLFFRFTNEMCQPKKVTPYKHTPSNKRKEDQNKKKPTLRYKNAGKTKKKSVKK